MSCEKTIPHGDATARHTVTLQSKCSGVNIGLSRHTEAEENLDPLN